MHPFLVELLRAHMSPNGGYIMMSCGSPCDGTLDVESELEIMSGLEEVVMVVIVVAMVVVVVVVVVVGGRVVVVSTVVVVVVGSMVVVGEYVVVLITSKPTKGFPPRLKMGLSWALATGLPCLPCPKRGRPSGLTIGVPPRSEIKPRERYVAR